MRVCVCLYVKLVSRSKDYARSRIKIVSVVFLYTPVLPSLPDMESIYIYMCIYATREPCEAVWPSGKAQGW